jgi:hypothetical protein
MLYISLVASALLLLVVNVAYVKKWRPTFATVLAAGVLAMGPVCVMFFLPLVALQGLLLVLGSVIGAHWQVRAGYFLIYSSLATILIYAGTGLKIAWDLEAARQLYPLEPLAERLPPRRPVAAAKPLPDSTASFLAAVEEQVSAEEQHARWYRGNTLSRLHEDKVSAFVNSPGFGVARMPYIAVASLGNVREEKSVAQPGPRDTSSLSSEPLQATPRGLDAKPLTQLHVKGLLDFVNPGAFGLVTQRKQIAGFQAHHFSEVPQEPSWTIQTIDLVGLVLHETPVVYVSENLPRMSELRKAPTRPLDNFELAGLEGLRAGDSIFVRTAPEGLRMLGGVRVVDKCVQCHGGEAGDLLGAFSYSLRSRSRPAD